MKRVRQNNYSYCGPAVLEMLVSHLGFHITQEEIALAAPIYERIETHGMTISDFSFALQKLSPDLSFWYKFESRPEDLEFLVTTHASPVGVEIQGDFEEENEDGFGSDNEDDDPGHYSVVTQVDVSRNNIVLADPYYAKDRAFTFKDFKKRWWDINEVFDPRTGQRIHVVDYRGIFIILPKDETFPQEIGMTTEFNF